LAVVLAVAAFRAVAQVAIGRILSEFFNILSEITLFIHQLLKSIKPFIHFLI
jgi:hypothetical protein